MKVKFLFLIFGFILLNNFLITLNACPTSFCNLECDENDSNCCETEE